MNKETQIIYLWPDGNWVRDEDTDDLDWYITSSGKSDDFSTYKVPIDLTEEGINELILSGVLK